jgi:hypothetical protein
VLTGVSGLRWRKSSARSAQFNRSVNKDMKRISLMIFACAMAIITGCTSTKNLNELHNFPKGTQFYSGSFLYDTWVYMGTKGDYHYFTYTYPEDSWLKVIRFRIPKDQLNLEFERQYSKDPKDYISVTPIHKAKQVVDFQKTISIFDRDLSPDLDKLK